MRLPFFTFEGCRAPAAVAMLLAALALAGCDPQHIKKLEEGVATEADVRARFGEPEKIWLPADLAGSPFPAVVSQPGARTLEYNRQPEGTVNYMITIGPDGRMSALRQVLTPQNFAQVQPGMPMEQVRKLLGRPMKVTPYALQRETHYDWRYISAPNTPRFFTVVFDRDLKVVRTGSTDAELTNPSGGKP